MFPNKILQSFGNAHFTLETITGAEKKKLSDGPLELPPLKYFLNGMQCRIYTYKDILLMLSFVQNHSAKKGTVRCHLKTPIL